MRLGCAEQTVAWHENDKEEQVNLFELSECGK